MAGRIRSALPLISRIARSDSSLAPHRAILSPAFNSSSESRNYATAAAPPKEVKIKVPMALYGGAANYASALYIAAKKANTLDKVEAELVDLVQALEKSHTFSQFTKDMSVPVDTRVKAINDITEQAKFSETTKTFLVVLAQNGRLRFIDTIAKKFSQLTMADKGIVQAIVTTVEPLPASEEKELKEILQEIIGQGKKVTLEQKIDASILGGLVVEFSQKVFDMSIKTRAQQMERSLREPINFSSAA
ncbi:ATP synthase subunit O, mitochondrial [Linum grandiflorum]